MNKSLIIQKILEEIDRQDEKWGTHFPGRTDSFWLTILAEEFGEIAEAILRRDDNDIEEEIIQTAAVCVSWLRFREGNGIPEA